MNSLLRKICLLPDSNNYIYENDIYLTNKKIDLLELNPKCEKIANALSFEIGANLDLIISFYYIKVGGFPLDINIGWESPKTLGNQILLLHVDETGKQKIIDWLPYLEKRIGNSDTTPLDKLFNNVQGIEIDYSRPKIKA